MPVGSAPWGVVDLGYEDLKIGIDVEDKHHLDVVAARPHGTGYRPRIEHKMR
ncbi:hypothetical protein GR927_22120 [Mycolicibacterium sp. 3033]|nr:hypothetical protein [Mycolicibacterium aurantiacum]